MISRTVRRHFSSCSRGCFFFLPPMYAFFLDFRVSTSGFGLEFRESLKNVAVDVISDDRRHATHWPIECLPSIMSCGDARDKYECRVHLPHSSAGCVRRGVCPSSCPLYPMDGTAPYTSKHQRLLRSKAWLLPAGMAYCVWMRVVEKARMKIDSNCEIPAAVFKNVSIAEGNLWHTKALTLHFFCASFHLSVQRP